MEAGASELPSSERAAAVGEVGGEACRGSRGEWAGLLAVGTQLDFTYVARGAARLKHPLWDGNDHGVPAHAERKRYMDSQFSVPSRMILEDEVGDVLKTCWMLLHFRELNMCMYFGQHNFIKVTSYLQTHE
jgi:hypothetical protein